MDSGGRGGRAVLVAALVGGALLAGCTGTGGAAPGSGTSASSTGTSTAGNSASPSTAGTGRSAALSADQRTCLAQPPPVTKEDPATYLSVPKNAPITPLTDDTKTELRQTELGWMVRPGMKQIDLGALVLVGDAPEAVLRTTVADLDRSVRVVSSLLGTGIDRGRELVLVPRAEKDYVRIFSGGDTGAAATKVADTTRGFYNWPVLALHPRARTEDPGGQLSLSITTHELTHLATDPEPGTPYWLIEGYAVLAEELLDPLTRESNDDAVVSYGRQLPTDDDFGEEADEDQMDSSYTRSASFVRYLCGLKGVDALSDFVTKVSSGWSLDDRVRAVYGTDLKTLVKGWQKAG